jgi:hypothetical protein
MPGTCAETLRTGNFSYSFRIPFILVTSWMTTVCNASKSRRNKGVPRCKLEAWVCPRFFDRTVHMCVVHTAVRKAELAEDRIRA